MQSHEEKKGGELQQIAYGYNVEVKGISGREIKQKKNGEKCDTGECFVSTSLNRATSVCILT